MPIQREQEQQRQARSISPKAATTGQGHMRVQPKDDSTDADDDCEDFDPHAENVVYPKTVEDYSDDQPAKDNVVSPKAATVDQKHQQELPQDSPDAEYEDSDDSDGEPFSSKKKIISSKAARKDGKAADQKRKQELSEEDSDYQPVKKVVSPKATTVRKKGQPELLEDSSNAEDEDDSDEQPAAKNGPSRNSTASLTAGKMAAAQPTPAKASALSTKAHSGRPIQSSKKKSNVSIDLSDLESEDVSDEQPVAKKHCRPARNSAISPTEDEDDSDKPLAAKNHRGSTRNSAISSTAGKAAAATTIQSVKNTSFRAGSVVVAAPKKPVVKRKSSIPVARTNVSAPEKKRSPAKKEILAPKNVFAPAGNKPCATKGPPPPSDLRRPAEFARRESAGNTAVSEKRPRSIKETAFLLGRPEASNTAPPKNQAPLSAKRPEIIKPDEVHVPQDIKPTPSGAELIRMAILAAPDRRLTSAQICQWVSDHFPSYKLGKPGWKGTIRADLTRKQAFRQERPGSVGSPWVIKEGKEDMFKV